MWAGAFLLHVHLCRCMGASHHSIFSLTDTVQGNKQSPPRKSLTGHRVGYIVPYSQITSLAAQRTALWS